jgi:hypothetical protein
MHVYAYGGLSKEARSEQLREALKVSKGNLSHAACFPDQVETEAGLDVAGTA